MRVQKVKLKPEVSHPDYDVVCFPDIETYDGYIKSFKAVGNKISITNISKNSIIEVLEEFNIK